MVMNGPKHQMLLKLHTDSSYYFHSYVWQKTKTIKNNWEFDIMFFTSNNEQRSKLEEFQALTKDRKLKTFQV